MPVLNDTPGYQLVAQDIKNVFKVIAETSTYAAKYNDYILANATDAAFTITLPAVSDGKRGGRVGIKKVDPTANAITIATTDTATIDGVTMIILTTQYEAYTMLADSTNWYIE